MDKKENSLNYWVRLGQSAKKSKEKIEDGIEKLVVSVGLSHHSRGGCLGLVPFPSSNCKRNRSKLLSSFRWSRRWLVVATIGNSYHIYV